MTLNFLPPPPQWKLLSPAEKIEHTRQRVAVEGLSYSAAAAALGTTRHGIAGTIERSSRTANPIRSSSGLKNQKGVRKGVDGGRVRAIAKLANKARAKPKARHAGFHKFVALAIPADAIARTPARQDVWEALPGSSPVAIADHHDGCRWPVGADLPFCYCNEAVKAESPYCPHHSAIAFREPPPRKDNGRRDSH